MANFLGLLIARNHRLGDDVRKRGLVGGPQLAAYASEAAHGCVSQAMQLAGLGSDALRLIACDARGAMLADALAARLQADRDAGLSPFLVVGTAGSSISARSIRSGGHRRYLRGGGSLVPRRRRLRRLPAFSPKLRGRLRGIERADSIAFDFHKWAHVPYDAGFLLARDGAALRRTFASERGYLTRAPTGLAAGETWPCDLGPDLSRGFRALKTWFTLRTFGADGLGRAIERNCELAARLAELIRGSAEFELSAPVGLNIVCFRVKSENADAQNRAIVERLHVSGRAAPSITLLGGIATIRCAIVNHRTRAADIDAFFEDARAAALEIEAWRRR